MRVLLIKTSSLGDVVHCLPAVSDMARHVSGLRLDWVIEEPFSEIARMHPAVERAVVVRLRSWRRRLHQAQAWREFSAFRRLIVSRRYDLIIDAQGLIRSALLARLACGPHCGYDAQSVREPPASFLYDRKFAASVTIHAVERIRRLVAQSVGYPLPAETGYGLDIVADRPSWLTADRHIVFAHATARPDKCWAARNWAELAQRASAEGVAIVAPWGSELERQRSAVLAARVPGVITPPRLGFRELASLMASATAVVGVDTGLTHLASAVGAPVVAIYAASWSEFNGAVGPAFVANLGGPGAPPSVDDVWAQTQRAMAARGEIRSWRPIAAEPTPELSHRRRFRPSSARLDFQRR